METLKANELRIGNYYDDNGTIRQVTPNTILDVWEAERTWCKPIPLTEEWLVKLGFKVGDNIHTNINFWFMPFEGAKRYFTYNLNSKMICFHDSYNLDLSNPTQTPCIQIPIKLEHVHTLQNLYFALTGNELTIKS